MGFRLSFAGLRCSNSMVLAGFFSCLEGMFVRIDHRLVHSTTRGGRNNKRSAWNVFGSRHPEGHISSTHCTMVFCGWISLGCGSPVGHQGKATSESFSAAYKTSTADMLEPL